MRFLDLTAIFGFTTMVYAVCLSAISALFAFMIPAICSVYSHIPLAKALRKH